MINHRTAFQIGAVFAVIVWGAAIGCAIALVLAVTTYVVRFLIQ